MQVAIESSVRIRIHMDSYSFYHRCMANWLCPHCGTPQPEASRCWVCHRSTISCGACLQYRRAVAGGLGYCGRDRSRAPITGNEIRECWVARADARSTSSRPSPQPALQPALRPEPARARSSRRHRTRAAMSSLWLEEA
jgi:hypothetical protein